MKSKYTLTIFVSFLIHTLYAQVSGGRHIYEFLNSPSSARINALGGTLLGLQDRDVATAILNPAGLNSEMHRQIHFSHNFNFAGISNGTFNYGHSLDSLGLTLHGGIQYINYGDFIASDIIGNQQGTFSGAEYALVVGASRKINDRIYAGINTKLILSNFESYSSTGIAFDLSTMYVNPENNTTWSLLFRSLGSQLSTYNDQREALPLDIQIAVTKKLTHLPFRWSITAHQLQQWSIRYDDPDQVAETNLFGETEEDSELGNAIDNFFRHMIFSGEFLLGKSENLKIRFAYNHLRRQELKVSEFRSFGGFSLGFGIKIRRFSFDYGVGYHHLAGSTNQISISTNLSEFSKKI